MACLDEPPKRIFERDVLESVIRGNDRTWLDRAAKKSAHWLSSVTNSLEKTGTVGRERIRQFGHAIGERLSERIVTLRKDRESGHSDVVDKSEIGADGATADVIPPVPKEEPKMPAEDLLGLDAPNKQSNDEELIDFGSGDEAEAGAEVESASERSKDNAQYDFAVDNADNLLDLWPVEPKGNSPVDLLSFDDAVSVPSVIVSGDAGVESERVTHLDDNLLGISAVKPHTMNAGFSDLHRMFNPDFHGPSLTAKSKEDISNELEFLGIDGKEPVAEPDIAPVKQEFDFSVFEQSSGTEQPKNHTQNSDIDDLLL